MWSNSTIGPSEGGFMDESYATTSAQPKSDKDANRSTNIIPMMIGHLKQCRKDTKTVWGANVRLVCIVGIVKKIEQSTTKVSYEISDETGTTKAFKWLETNAPAPEDILENHYAKIHGSLREQNKKTHVLILKITPVKTYVEVFSHLAEVVFIAMKSKKNIVQPVEDSSTVGGPVGGDDVDEDNCHGLTNDQKMVYKVIKSTNKEGGIERSEIKSQVPSNLMSKVDNILEFLASEGHIYTTCTDDHFLAT